MNRKYLYCLVTLLITGIFLPDFAHAQRRKKTEEEKEISIYDVDSLVNPIPLQRKNWHDKIDQFQKKARADFKYVNYSDDTALTNSFKHALLEEVDHMQIMVENLPYSEAQTEANEKLNFLKGINQMMSEYKKDASPNPAYYKKVIANMHDLIIASHKNNSMGFIQNNISFQTLNNVKALFSSGSPQRALIYREMGKKEPQVMIKKLTEFANESYADDVISAAARVVPNEVFNYASSTNVPLGNAVRRSKDPLVQTIVRISQESKAPLKAMPFLNDIYTKSKTIPEIDAIASNPDLFFVNLVRLKVEGVELGGDTYTDELKYRGLKYVREMNDLHEAKDPVRFKCLDKFSPEALYFIMVYGQDEIYTSSFLGTYKRMMERMKPLTGDQFLDKVHRDKFRTFIRMCAGYNTLSGFLTTMDAEHKNQLMRAFIAGLEKGKDDDLEDAVDVADAFGSIEEADLAAFLDRQVKDNYEAAYKVRSKKGVIVYGLMATLFEGLKGMDSVTAALQSEKLNLPPINSVLYKNLVNDTGTVYEQVFFYGDEDGKASYTSFLGNFPKDKWKFETNKFWTTITSIANKRVVVFANLPVPEPGDEEAQKELKHYLDSLEIHPTIVIHRGHSYHLPLTIDMLQRETRIVMLGSCGGYHNLGKVLDHSPDAHIISSKQVGARDINEPIIRAINDNAINGTDVEWITMWRGLNGYFSLKGKEKYKELFDDYIPPHKNLGAIFIKAYRKMLNSIDED
jgi:hypothetical protein